MKKWLLSACIFLATLCGHSQTVASPTFSPSGGTITGAVNVTMSTTTSGATIFYCYSGSAITSCSGTANTYSGPVYVNPTTVEYLCAYGTKTGYTNSSTYCQTYTKSSGTTASPAISPASGTYVMPQTITITDTTGGSTITYGTTAPAGGCTPSTTYTGPFSISPTGSETVCAQATAPGLANSPVVSSNYNTSNFATGDTIARVEPTFPLTTTCATYAATIYKALTNTVDLNPWNPTIATSGVLNSTGGTSFEPSATPPPTYTASGAETDDTGLQTLINTTTKPCVEVTLGTSGQDALVLAPGFKPQTTAGVGIQLIVDGGVDLYISRNLSDFGGGSCGNWSGWPADLSCPKWITPTADGVGIYGYGALNGRAWSRFTSSSNCPSGYSPCSPATLKVLSYCLQTANARVWPPDGTAQIPCPTGTQTSDTNNVANGSNVLEMDGTDHVVLYKISILNSGQFHVNLVGDNDVLAWGIKMLTCGHCSNTDGFDPVKSTNFSMYYSFCSLGDNCDAIKTNTSSSAGTQSANGTFSHNQEGAGIGWTIGYNSTASSGIGVQNILFDTQVINGGYRVNSHSQVGWGINGGSGQGGRVDTVTFQHTCATNETITSQYIGGPGQMTNVNELDTHILNGSLTGNSGELKYEGNNSSTLLGITLNSIIADGAVTHSTSNSDITIGGLGVSSNIYAILTGTNVTTSPNTVPAPTTTAVACTTSTWKPLIGELWFSTSANNNLQTLSTPAPATYTLNATLMPTTAWPSTKESLFLNQTGTQGNPVAKVEFLDNGTPIASCSGSNAVQLIHGNVYAVCPLSAVPAGTHVYTARYNASGTDTNYPTNFVWGNPGTGNTLISTVTGGTTTPVAPQITAFSVGP